jgi:protein-S-isoprenylcysteine O-methyltransferase Ste14
MKEPVRVRKAAICGWTIEFVGTAVWLFGYFVIGHPPLINWHASTPWWIADYLPNIESEIGMLMICAGAIPLYWPARRERSAPSLDAQKTETIRR